jgi:hypothetical protein
LPLSISIISRRLSFQNWTVLLKLCLSVSSFCFGKYKTGFIHCFLSSHFFCQLDDWCCTSSWNSCAF